MPLSVCDPTKTEPPNQIMALMSKQITVSPKVLVHVLFPVITSRRLQRPVIRKRIDNERRHQFIREIEVGTLGYQ